MAKEEKLGLLILFVLIAFLTTFVVSITIYIKEQKKSFTTFKNGEIYEGIKKCWLESGIAYCEIDNVKTNVDLFYEED